MSFLLDTNIVSEWVKLRPSPKVISWLANVDEDRVHLSVVTIAEIKYGIERLHAGRRRHQLADWLGQELLPRFEGRILPIDREIAAGWGSIVASRDKAGRPIGVIDAFIASTAAAYDLTLVTCDAADFEGVVAEIVNPSGG